MIKTIIADDERWVCQLISNMVDWEAYGFSLIGNAYDGENLFRMITQLHPDLVVTDIRMPGMDGLEVIRKTREAGIRTKFIIISGYSDFEYAKSAIELGVSGYLLKPIEKEELQQFLESAKQDIFSHQTQAYNDTLLRKQLEKSQTQCVEYYLQNFLADDKAEAMGPEQMNRQFESSFQHGFYRMDCMTLDGKHESCVDVWNEVADNIIELGYSLFRNFCYDMSLFKFAGNIMVLLNYSTENVDKIKSLFGDFFYFIQTSIPHISRFEVTLGLGKPVLRIEEIKQSYRAAVKAARARIRLGKNIFIDLEDKKFTVPNDMDLVSVEKEKQIIEYVSQKGDLDAHEIINALFASCMANDTLEPETCFRIAHKCVRIVLNTLSPNSRLALNEQMEENPDAAIDSFGDISALKAFLSVLLQNARENMFSHQKKSGNVIEAIKTYIDEHYSEDVKLNDIARHVFLNPNYVSDLFKSETGINFSKYLVNKRMEMAKAYLMDPRYNVRDVAALVGYSDAKYFTKLFKGNVGVSPVQFRKMFY